METDPGSHSDRRAVQGALSDSADSPRGSLIGRDVGGFVITGFLGRGAFADVFRATSTTTQEEVALKFPQDTVSESRRFLDIEEEALGRLRGSRYVRQLVSRGEYQNKPFLVLESIPECAGDWLDDSDGGLLTIPCALSIIYQVTLGLAHAHHLGIVHRSVKPHDILLDRGKNLAKLCDFGVARFLYKEDWNKGRAGICAPAYMSPEQWRTGEVDNRSDIYALGVTCYEFLCGRRPFKADSPTELARRVLGGDYTPLSAYLPDVDQRVVALIERAISREPHSRYPTAMDMAADILQVCQGIGLPIKDLATAHKQVNIQISRLPQTPQDSSRFVSDAEAQAEDVGSELTLLPQDTVGNFVPPDTPPTTQGVAILDSVKSARAREEEDDFLTTRANESEEGAFTELEKGARVGDYEIEELIGMGAFCAVYRAIDVNLDRQAALKFRSANGMSDEKLFKYFEREAKAIAKLNDCRSVVDIYSMGNWRRRAFLALEFVDTSASHLLKENPDGLPCDRAMEIAADVAAALYESHRAGIVHRDIKPGNILVSSGDGSIKVADFGLALFYEKEGRQETEVCGTLPYMAPEQLEGSQIGPSADVYSLGITLYELLCGKRPHPGRNLDEIRHQVREGDRVPLQERRRDIPSPVQEIVDRALAFEPEKRFNSAGEMCALLREVLHPVERGAYSNDSKTPLQAAKKRLINVFVPSSRPYSAFISYRRTGGAEAARSICSELIRRGRKAFLDVDDLGKHMFDERLLAQIEVTPNFIPVLSRGCLERCSHNDDWFRREITHAIRNDRNIVPITLEGFEYPLVEDMPIGLRDLSRYQSVPYSHDYFGATMEKILEFLA